MERYQRLLDVLRAMPPHGVAFSGGVDSTLLLRAAAEAWPSDVRAFMVTAPFHAKHEQEEARALARLIGAALVEIPLDTRDVPGLIDNPPDRCYICKRACFSAVLEAARKAGLHGMADGSNVDDMSEYRPGLRAVRELGVRSPLAEAGLTKSDIREISRLLDLPTADKPALACIATRIPHGVELTEERLRAVEAAELAVWSLGFPGARVRHHGEVARVEVARHLIAEAAQKADELAEAVRGAGFRYAALDLDGYRVGSMN